MAPDLVEALCATDADVVAFYPYLYYPSVRGIGRCPMPAVLHPAAHDEPALYLPVFRGTFAAADASATTPWPSAGWSSGSTPWPTGPRSSSASGVGESAGGRGGRAARCWGWATGPTW